MQSISIETLAKSPAFAAAIRELEAAQLAERRAQIDALADFRAQWHGELADLNAKAQEARRKLDEQRALMLEAERASDEANSAALWRATRLMQQDRRLEAAILAGADPRLEQFRAWAARAANLAGLATYEQVAAFAGTTVPPSNARQAREVCRLCDEAIERADEMRREAIGTEDVALELDALAAGILRGLDRMGGSAAARLPRDWQAPLI